MTTKQENTKREKWLIFCLNNRELCSYTLEGTFPGGKAATIELLASEHNVKEEEIKTYIELR